MNFRLLCLIPIISFSGLTSCSNQRIETGEKLSPETIVLIKRLGLLNEDENIIKYYSNFRQNKAGNFFTTKRIAHYWLDSHRKEENDTSFAFYSDIAYIDTIFDVPDTFAPYMTITKTDSSKFKVYIGGTKNEMKSFFEEAIQTWKKQK